MKTFMAQMITIFASLMFFSQHLGAQLNPSNLESYTAEERLAIEANPSQWAKTHIHSIQDPGLRMKAQEKFRTYRLKTIHQKDSIVDKCQTNQNRSSELNSFIENFEQMQKEKAIKYQLHFPEFNQAIVQDDYDILFIIVGAGRETGHHAPQKIIEQMAGKNLKALVINLDPHHKYSIAQDHHVKKMFLPIHFPGHDGSGFFIPETEFDKTTLETMDQVIKESQKKGKHIVFISTISSYPLDTIIHLWTKWKDGGNVTLIHSYDSTPTLVFNPHLKEMPQRNEFQEMIGRNFGFQSNFFFRNSRLKKLQKSSFGKWGTFHYDLKDVDLDLIKR